MKERTSHLQEGPTLVEGEGGKRSKGRDKPSTVVLNPTMEKINLTRRVVLWHLKRVNMASTTKLLDYFL